MAEKLEDVALTVANMHAPRWIGEALRRLFHVLQPAHALLVFDGKTSRIDFLLQRIGSLEFLAGPELIDLCIANEPFRAGKTSKSAWNRRICDRVWIIDNIGINNFSNPMCFSARSVTIEGCKSCFFLERLFDAFSIVSFVYDRSAGRASVVDMDWSADRYGVHDCLGSDHRRGGSRARAARRCGFQMRQPLADGILDITCGPGDTGLSRLTRG